MEVHGWLQIVPRLVRGEVRSATIGRVTQTRPTSPEPGAVLVQVSIKVPDSVFEPFRAYGELPDGARIVPFDIEIPEEEPNA